MYRYRINSTMVMFKDGEKSTFALPGKWEYEDTLAFWDETSDWDKHRMEIELVYTHPIDLPDMDFEEKYPQAPVPKA